MAHRRSLDQRGLALLLALALPGCDSNEVLPPDPSVAPFVGQWDAIELVFTPAAGTGSPVDVLASGATMFLDIQPSGLYTAYLALSGATSTEIGRLEVGATRLVLRADYPRPGASSGAYEISEDQLSVEGQTETSLGLPGTPSLVEVRMVFQRR